MRLAAVSFLALALSGAFAVARAQDCTSAIPPAMAGSDARRALTVDDLLRLRDIGLVDNNYRRTLPFALSPDGGRVALQLRQADPGNNRYCLAVVVTGVDQASAPVIINQGGEAVRGIEGAVGFAPEPDNLATITPKWSPDGQWVAFIRNDGAFDQIWRARADGSRSEPVTQANFNVERFVWDPSGTGVVFSGRPAMIEARRAIEAEALRGYLFDDRYRPSRSSQPQVREPIAEAFFHQEIGEGRLRPATEDEQALLVEPAVSAVAADAISVWRGKAGRVAWTALRDPNRILLPTVIKVRDGRGERVCATELCAGVTDLWWVGEGGDLVFFTSDNWIKGKTTFYRWKAGQKSPQPFLATDDALIGCEHGKGFLICAQEGALQPRRLVRIDLATGNVASVFDPNPEFLNLRLGAVERLRVTNAFAIESFADLVFPVDYTPGTRYPLIVVGYQSRGFLRGGVGDDYPIQLYASKGFAVLSFQRPRNLGLWRGSRSPAEIVAQDRADAADWRNVHSSLALLIDRLDARGVIDRSRIGLTGFSNGASSAQYSLINSDLFVAAALSHCCEDTTSFTTVTGPAYSRFLQAFSYPGLTQDGEKFWAPMSIRMNVDKVKAPILVQTDNYLLSLESVMALMEKKKPVELYYFPNESHVKWQPAHRKAVYERSLDWFDYWLNGRIDPSPDKASQYGRWRNLKTARDEVQTPS